MFANFLEMRIALKKQRTDLAFKMRQIVVSVQKFRLVSVDEMEERECGK